METDKLSEMDQTELSVIYWIATRIRPNLLDNVDLTEFSVMYWKAKDNDLRSNVNKKTLGKVVEDAADGGDFDTSRVLFQMRISALQNNKEQLYEVIFRPCDSIQTNAIKVLMETIQGANIEILAEVFYKACESGQRDVVEIRLRNIIIPKGDKVGLWPYEPYLSDRAYMDIITYYDYVPVTGVTVIKWMMNNVKALNNIEHLRRALYMACDNNQEAVVKDLVAHSALCNDSSALLDALSIACKRDWFYLVKWMMTNTVLRNDVNALIAACSAGSTNKIAHWMVVNNDVNANIAALYLACEKSHLELLQRIAESTELLDDTSTVSVALTTAVACGCGLARLNVIEYIVTQGKLNDKLDILVNALSCSCESGLLDIVKWLMEHTALKNVDNETLNDTLDRACCSGQLDVVKWLINNTTVDINCSNDKKDSPLHSIIWKDKMGDFKRLHWACRPGGDLEEVSRLLYLCDDDVNEQNNDGDTALHRVCYNGSIAIAKALMWAGADVTITNDDRLTPIQMAENEGHKEMLKVLNRLAQ